MLKKFIISGFLLLVASQALDAKDCCGGTLKNPDWPSMSHDYCNTNSNRREFRIGTNNVQNLTLSYITKPEIPAATSPYHVDTRFIQFAQPIVADGVLYYGNFNGGTLTAANVDDGSIIWQFSRPGDFLFSTPVVTDKFVYVTVLSTLSPPPNFADLVTLFALNKLTGHVVWSANLEQQFTNATSESGLSVVDNLLIVPTDTSSETDAVPNPVSRGGITALDADTGKQVWHFTPPNGPGGGFAAAPAFDTKRKLMFIGSLNCVFEPGGKTTDALLALDYTTGKLKWSYQFTKNDVGALGEHTSVDMDVISNANLFSAEINGKKRDLVGINSKKGVYAALERETGKLVWKRNISPGFPELQGDPSAAFAHDTIYTIASWTPTQLITSEVEKFVFRFPDPATITFYYDVLLNKTTTTVYALNPKNGKIKWRRDFPGAVQGSISEANGVLYTGTMNGQLIALDAKNGNILFTYQFPLGNTTCPVCPPPVDFPNNPPVNLPLLPTPLLGLVTIVDGRVFVPAGLYDLRITDASGIGGGIYVFTVPNPNVK